MFLPDAVYTPEEDRAYFWRWRCLADREVWWDETYASSVRGARPTSSRTSTSSWRPAVAGIGGALIDRAKERRPGGFELRVFQQNENARRFYEGRGFVLVRERTGERGAHA